MNLFVVFWVIFLGGCFSASQNNESPLVSIQIQDRNGLTETISTQEKLEHFSHVDFLASQPYKKVLRVYKNKGKNTAKITSYHPNGIPWQYLEAQDSRAFGLFREWHPNGHLKIEAFVIGGTADISPGAQQDWLFDQTAKVYDEQGNLIAEIPYEKGVMEGESVYYAPNGSILRKLPYHKNELNGDALEYYSDGELLSKASYLNGLKSGESLCFWHDQTPSSIEKYQEGLLQEGSYYSSKGELLSKVAYGQGFQSLFADGALSQMVEIRKGKAEGQIKTFTPSGELRSTHQIRQGKKHGEEIIYYTSYESEGDLIPQPKISIPWVDDAISGIAKTWYPNGRLQSQKEISRNKKTGSALAWYRDGGLMFVEDYEEDRLLKGTYYKKNQKEPTSSVTNGNGIATLFDEEGIFIRKVQYQKGKPVDPEG